MAPIPPPVARKLVLRRLPRFLRVGLGDLSPYGPAPDALVADAARIDPELGRAAQAFVDAGYPPMHDGLRVLDAYAAMNDLPSLGEIADTLLLLAPPTGRLPTAPRLAGAAWNALDRLDGTGVRIRRLALANAVAGDVEFEIDDIPLDDFMRETYPADGRRLRDAREAWRDAVGAAFDVLSEEARALATGLATLHLHGSGLVAMETVGATALHAGLALLRPVRDAAVRAERRKDEAASARLARRLPPPVAPAEPPEAATAAPVAGDGVIVCRALGGGGSQKGKEIARGYEHAIGKSLPLVPMPDLPTVRARLVAEFPYAIRTVDAVLSRLLGKRHVALPPLLIVGGPGVGKSRFARRLVEELGLGALRVDGAGDAGPGYGGTERRWYSAEPSRPFMACARHRQANPAVIVEELDKAPVRSDYGRLWDALLATVGAETASRYQDPALQAETDISHVVLLCTANTETVLPAPLLDRLTLVRFPGPEAGHLDALLPATLAAIAAEADHDPRFHAPLDAVEREAVRRRWRGGSLRRLRRLVEAVLRVRERAAVALPN